MSAAWVIAVAAAAVLSLAWLAGTLDPHHGTRAAPRRKVARAENEATLAWVRGLHGPRRSRARGVVVASGPAMCRECERGYCDAAHCRPGECACPCGQFASQADIDAADGSLETGQGLLPAPVATENRDFLSLPSLVLHDLAARLAEPALTEAEAEDLAARLAELAATPGRWIRVMPPTILLPVTEPPLDPTPAAGLLHACPDVPQPPPSTYMSPALAAAVADLDRHRDPQPTPAEAGRWPWLAPAAWADKTGSFEAVTFCG